MLDSDVSRTEFKRVMGFSHRPDPDAAMRNGGKADPEGDCIYDECYDAWVDVRASAAGHADHPGVGKCCLDHNEKVRRYGEIHGRAVRYSAKRIRDGISDRLARRPPGGEARHDVRYAAGHTTGSARTGGQPRTRRLVCPQGGC